MVCLLPEIRRMSTTPVCIRRTGKRGLLRQQLFRKKTITAGDIDIIVIDCIKIVLNLKRRIYDQKKLWVEAGRTGSKGFFVFKDSQNTGKITRNG